MKKLVLLGAGVVAAGSVALISAGGASSEPDLSMLNVIGEPYAKAVKILRNQGVKAAFGGSRGSALPQAQCLVDSQKIIASGKMLLMLDCTEAAAEQAAENGVGGPPGPPHVGSNGITTVTPKVISGPPPPGM